MLFRSAPSQAPAPAAAPGAPPSAAAPPASDLDAADPAANNPDAADPTSDPDAALPRIGLVVDPPAAATRPPAPDPKRAEDFKGRLEALLIRLADLAREQGMRTLAAEITGDRLPALRSGRVTAVVLGEFNHGKSTILNALLGRDVLPMGITPTTSVITHLRWGDKPGALVHYGDNDTREVSLDDLPRLVGPNQKVDPRYVEVFYPSPLLQDNLVLVDTPGVNDISRQRVEITYGYLPRADVIIYVLDANQVLKRSEITFIRDRLLKASRDRLIFVLGKIDTLDDAEREEVETYAREKLTELVGPPELYPVSARRAIKGDDPGFNAFRARLVDYLKDRKAHILIDSGVSGGLRVAGMLNQSLAIKRRGYALDKVELQRRVEAVRARLNTARQAIYENLDRIDETTRGMKATARHNLREFTARFAEALPREVDRASIADIKLHLGDWIRDTFKDWLEQEGNAIARELERLAEEVIETTNANLGQAVDDIQDELGLKAAGIDLDVNTLTYDVGVYALGLGGLSIALLGGVLVGGLVMLAAPLLAIFVKDKIEDKTRALAHQEGVRVVRKAGEEVEAELVRVIEEYGDKLKTFVESAGDRLYQQIDEALGQASRDINSESADRETLDARAQDALKAVEDITAGFEALRDKLVAP